MSANQAVRALARWRRELQQPEAGSIVMRKDVNGRGHRVVDWTGFRLPLGGVVTRTGTASVVVYCERHGAENRITRTAFAAALRSRGRPPCCRAPAPPEGWRLLDTALNLKASGYGDRHIRVLLECTCCGGRRVVRRDSIAERARQGIRMRCPRDPSVKHATQRREIS